MGNYFISALSVFRLWDVRERSNSRSTPRRGSSSCPFWFPVDMEGIQVDSGDVGWTFSRAFSEVQDWKAEHRLDVVRCGFD